MLQHLGTTAPAPGLLACAVKTRIGPSAVFGETRTEPLPFVSHEAHRTSTASRPETASDLGLYSQPDPIGLKGGPNLFGYASADPVSVVDPLGLKVCRCDRRLDNPVSGFLTLWPFWSAGIYFAGGHHTYIEIIPPYAECGGLQGVAWGFQKEGGGTVRPEGGVGGNFNPQVMCREIPCIDEGQLRRNISNSLHKPPAYREVSCLGKGWNSANCQGWADAMLDRSRISCCSTTSPGWRELQIRLGMP